MVSDDAEDWILIIRRCLLNRYHKYSFYNANKNIHAKYIKTNLHFVGCIHVSNGGNVVYEER